MRDPPVEGTVAFHRSDEEGRVEVVVGPECGPTPVGDWMACDGNASSLHCGCACAES